MPEETTSIDYVMEAASGPHFSGLRLDGLRSSPPSSSTSSPAAHRSPVPASAFSSSSLSSALTDSNALKQPFVIGVSGGTASGKTTVCDMIIQQLHDHRVVLVNQDSFYRGLTAEESNRVNEYNFDHPDAFDTEQLLDCIQNLKNWQPYQVPIYDFKIHRRCKDSFRLVNASDVIILEGILVFHDQHVRNLMDMKIFVDTDADVRLARRIRRDTVERGRDINSVLEQIFGSQWVMPGSVVSLVYCWNYWLGKFNSNIWNMVPSCLMWIVWTERNRRSFEDTEKSLAQLQALCLKT